jgi:hypothetical protein
VTPSPPSARLGSLAAALAIAGALVAANACSSSSSGGSSGATGDGGDDGSSSYGPQPSDASAEGEGGDAAGEAQAVCHVPAEAMMPVTQTEAGAIGCTPMVGTVQCDPSSFLLVCVAPDPITGVPVPPASLSCNYLTNTVPTRVRYCCPCQ